MLGITRVSSLTRLRCAEGGFNERIYYSNFKIDFKKNSMASNVHLNFELFPSSRDYIKEVY